jgi:hypothetical protein
MHVANQFMDDVLLGTLLFIHKKAKVICFEHKFGDD